MAGMSHPLRPEAEPYGTLAVSECRSALFALLGQVGGGLPTRC